MKLSKSSDDELRPIGKEKEPKGDLEKTKETPEGAEETEQLNQATFIPGEYVELKDD